MMKRKTLHALLLVGYGLKNDVDFFGLKTVVGQVGAKQDTKGFVTQRGIPALL